MTDRQKRYPPFGWLLIGILFCAALLDIVMFYTLPLRYLYPGTFDAGKEKLTVAAILFNDFNPSFTGINNETKRRVQHGAAMLKQNRVEQLIVVGGNRAASKRKGARLMADYLLELGRSSSRTAQGTVYPTWNSLAGFCPSAISPPWV
jgi:hypothetical protein